MGPPTDMKKRGMLEREPHLEVLRLLVQSKSVLERFATDARALDGWPHDSTAAALPCLPVLTDAGRLVADVV